MREEHDRRNAVACNVKINLNFATIAFGRRTPGATHITPPTQTQMDTLLAGYWANDIQQAATAIIIIIIIISIVVIIICLLARPGSSRFSEPAKRTRVCTSVRQVICATRT